MQALQLCVKHSLGSGRMGQCTGGGGSLICPSHFFQSTVGGAGAVGKGLPNLVTSLPQNPTFYQAAVELATEK